MTWLQHWLAYMTGSLNTSGAPPNYNFWSGVGSDIGELAMFGWLATFLRRHNCEVHRCWRLGRHATAAGHVVCRRHHPDGKLTAGHVAQRHQEAGGKA